MGFNMNTTKDMIRDWNWMLITSWYFGIVIIFIVAVVGFVFVYYHSSKQPATDQSIQTAIKECPLVEPMIKSAIIVAQEKNSSYFLTNEDLRNISEICDKKEIVARQLAATKGG